MQDNPLGWLRNKQLTSGNVIGQSARTPCGQSSSPERPHVRLFRDARERRALLKSFPHASDAEPGEDETWRKLAAAGRLSGHVICRCPACGNRQMVAYRPASQPWPVCRICVPEHLTMSTQRGFPRLEPLEVDDLMYVSKRPGLPRTPRELLALGYVRRKDQHAQSAVDTRTRRKRVRNPARGDRSAAQADPAAAAEDDGDPITRDQETSRRPGQENDGSTASKAVAPTSKNCTDIRSTDMG